MIHPLNGFSHWYDELSILLREKYNIFGIESIGINETREPLSSIEDMAKEYVKSIINIQSNGVYHILGWSFGALIAFEMGKLLKSKDKTTNIILIDPDVSKLENKAITKDEILKFFTMFFISDKTIRFTKPTDDNLNINEYIERIFEDIISNITKNYHKKHILEMQRLFDIYKANFKALLSYHIKGSIDDTIIYGTPLFKQSGNIPIWKERAKNANINIISKCDHYSILKGKNLQKLARSILKN